MLEPEKISMASLTLFSLFTRHPTNFRPSENPYAQVVNLHGTIKTVREFTTLAVQKLERKSRGQRFSQYGRKFNKYGVNTTTNDKATFIMYTAGRGGGACRGYFFQRQNFLRSPLHHTEFLTTPPPLPRHAVLTRKVKYRQYDEMVERWMFQIENKKQKVTKGYRFLWKKICKEGDLKMQALYFFEAQIPSESTSATEGTGYI